MTTNLRVDQNARRGTPLVDGIDKVTGRARYTADLDHDNVPRGGRESDVLHEQPADPRRERQ